jgi:hypothetical protein
VLFAYVGSDPRSYADYLNALSGRMLEVQPGGAYDVHVAPGRNPGLPLPPGDGRWAPFAAEPPEPAGSDEGVAEPPAGPPVPDVPAEPENGPEAPPDLSSLPDENSPGEPAPDVDQAAAEAAATPEGDEQ